MWVMTLPARVEWDKSSLRAPWEPLRVGVTLPFALTGTAARFSGQSFWRYSLPKAQNWHIRFRLTTLQSQAILLFSNKTAWLSLKVRHCQPERFHVGVPGRGGGAAEERPRRLASASKSLPGSQGCWVWLPDQNTRPSSHDWQSHPPGETCPGITSCSADAESLWRQKERWARPPRSGWCFCHVCSVTD